MKKFLTLFSVICLSVLAFSCKKNDDPADNDLFVGTYKGKISFLKLTPFRSGIPSENLK